jgi:HEAT repeat protein
MIAQSPNVAEPKVRASAVTVLSRMPGEKAREKFRECLRSSKEFLCISAINAVAVGKLTEYVENLEELAKNSKSEAVRLKASLSLSELTSR